MLSMTRLLVFEVTLGIVFFVVLQQPWAMMVGGVLGVAAVAAMFGRSNGRWWTDTFMLWLRYKMRSGSSGSKRQDPRLAALCELAPDLVIEDIDDQDDKKLGMGSDSAGWFAVLEVATTSIEHALPPVPIAALAKIASEAEQAGVVMQVVSHTSAMNGTAARDHVIWVAVRLDASAVAQSMIDHAGKDVDIPAVLAEVVHRAERLLRRRDLRVRTLPAEELVDALARSCDLLPTAQTVVREDWDAWNSTRLVHGCFWLHTWPDAERTAWLLAMLAEVPAALVSIAFIIEPSYEGTSIRCLVRVATTREHYRQTCDRVMRVAGWAGAQMSRLDGQHAPAVYASAPSGGGAR
ncbi:hypothetical protein BAY61_01045 [Prauserella marina]|nr:hypothetical protein BAY61_01045 [Prauserella marina]